MALTNKTNIRKRTVMDGLKKTFGKASQAISEKVKILFQDFGAKKFRFISELRFSF